MTTFQPGDRVRCIQGNYALTEGCEYVVAAIEDDDEPGVEIKGLFGRWFTGRFVLAAAAHEPAPDPWRNFIPAGVEPPFAMSGGPQSGIPATARAIMNLVPERKVPLTEKQQTQGEGVARAVDRLSHFEPRLGCHAWRP